MLKEKREKHAEKQGAKTGLNEGDLGKKGKFTYLKS